MAASEDKLRYAYVFWPVCAVLTLSLFALSTSNVYATDGTNIIVNQLSINRLDNTSGIIIEEYLYDHEGRRIYRRSIPENTTYYYPNRHFVRMINSSGTFDTIYYYDSNDLIARRDVWDNNRTYYYHPDHLGSTTLITDENGNTAAQLTYEPYGLVFSGDPNASQRLYTGKELDGSTGLYYYGARYYDPELGQFVEPDPEIPDPYDPQMLNRFSYARGNPYKYTDPSGNLPVKSETGNLGEFESYIKRVESTIQLPFDIGEKQVVMLNVLVGFFNGEAENTGAPNLIRTEKGGWVDTRHYTFSSLVRSVSGSNTGLLAGYVVEALQGILGLSGDKGQASSFLNPEDMPSYAYGAYSTPKGLFSDEITDAFGNLGAVNKENSPDWDYLPETRKEVKPGFLPANIWNPWITPTDSYWGYFWDYNKGYAEKSTPLDDSKVKI